MYLFAFICWFYRRNCSVVNLAIVCSKVSLIMLSMDLGQCFPNFRFSTFRLLLCFFPCWRCPNIHLVSTVVPDLGGFRSPRHPTLGNWSRCLSMSSRVGVDSVGTFMFCKWFLYASQSALWNCFRGVIDIWIWYAKISNMIRIWSKGAIGPGEMCELWTILWLSKILSEFPNPLCDNVAGKDEPKCCILFCKISDVNSLAMLLSWVSCSVPWCPLMSLIKYVGFIMLDSVW